MSNRLALAISLLLLGGWLACGGSTLAPQPPDGGTDGGQDGGPLPDGGVAPGWQVTPIGTVAIGSVPCELPSIAVGTDAKPVFGYCQQTASDNLGKVVQRNGSAWTQLGGPFTNAHLFVAVDGTVPAVAYTAPSPAYPALFVAEWTGSAWTPLGGQLSDSGLSVVEPRLVSGPAGLVAAWKEWDPVAGNGYTLRAARWTGSAWSRFGSGVSPAQEPLNPGLSVLPDGRPALAWLGAGLGSVKTVRWNPGTASWDSLPDIAGTGAMGEVLVGYNLTADGAGSLHHHVRWDVLQAPLRMRPAETAWADIGLPASVGTLARTAAAAGRPGTGGLALAWNETFARFAAYDGSSWTLVADKLNGTYYATPRLAVAPDGTIYVALVYMVGGGAFPAQVFAITPPP